MNKTEIKSFNSAVGTVVIGLLSAVVVTLGFAAWQGFGLSRPASYKYENTKFGSFLAQQHAIYVNDFESAAEFAQDLKEIDIKLVKTTNVLADFLAGNIDDSAKMFADDDSISGRFVYTAYLITQDNWKAVYEKFKASDSAFTAPIRIWSGIATNHITATLKFIDSLPAHDSWKSFTKGHIYAELNRPEKAAEHFAKVSSDFLNINDYLYMMAFYEHNGFESAADSLHDDFTRKPGGLFMLNMPLDHDYAPYNGFRNALSFSLIQTVSHSQILGTTDLALVLLRLAGASGTDNADALNYYLGMYFYDAGGDFKLYFDQIPKNSIFYPFVLMKYAESTGNYNENVQTLEKLIHENRLFIPAINNLVAKKLQKGREKEAIRILDSALGQRNLPSIGRAFLLRSRARANVLRGDFNRAQQDIRAAADILPSDSGIISEQAKIWALTDRNLDDAYSYAIALVKKFPGDLESWDTLGLVVWKREGAVAALDILEKVARVAVTNSQLFEHLGDIYIDAHNHDAARRAYQRAMELSDDGLVSEVNLRKKLRKIK